MFLYTQPIPDRALETDRRSVRQQLTNQAVLNGSADAKALGGFAGDETLAGAYRGQDAADLARSLRELADAGDIGPVPLYDPEAPTPLEGYYAVEEVAPEAPIPQARDRLQTFRLSLSEAGTRRSQFRRLATEVVSRTQDLSTSTEEQEVRLPAAARRVRWWDGKTATQPAAPTATESAARGDLEVYDLTASPYSEATLLYDLPYAAEGRVDCTVWRSFGDRYRGDQRVVVDGETVTVAAGESQTFDSPAGISGTLAVGGEAIIRDTEPPPYVRWARVFDPAAELGSSDLPVVISTRRLRVSVDDVAETISATRYSPAVDDWEPVPLGASSWVPIDIDFRAISAARAVARVTFADGSGEYALDLAFPRGATNLRPFRTRANEDTDPTPQGLIDLLKPIAATTTYGVQVDRGLVARSGVTE